MVDVGGQGVAPAGLFRHRVPSRGSCRPSSCRSRCIAAFFFALIALIFIGLGQVMGRAFNRLPNRVLAYTINVLGSLAGIACFRLASYFRTSPVIWFAIGSGACLYFVKRSRVLHGRRVLRACWLLVAHCSSGVTARQRAVLGSSGRLTIRSPIIRGAERIATNNIEHQSMVAGRRDGAGLLAAPSAESGRRKRPFEDVLIIGAGSGNDVQAALAQGCEARRRGRD